MSISKSSNSTDSSDAVGDVEEEVVPIDDDSSYDLIYEAEPKKRKRVRKDTDPVKEAEMIEDLKPKKNFETLEALYEGGTILKKKAKPIYDLEEPEEKEALYKYNNDDVVYDTIYEKVGSSEETVYAKGKERNKETTISKEKKEEHVGRYSDMEVDYNLDESPYHEVYLEEIVTEGKPSAEKMIEVECGGEDKKPTRKRKKKCADDEDDVEQIDFID